jgi:hypothetical protein
MNLVRRVFRMIFPEVRIAKAPELKKGMYGYLKARA